MESIEQLLKEIKSCFEKSSFKPGKNLKRELLRLIFEIARKEKKSPSQIIGDKKFNDKKALIKFRNELIIRRFGKLGENLAKNNIYLPPLPSDLEYSFVPREETEFYPKKIYYEKDLKESEFLNRIIDRFPEARLERIDSIKEIVQQNKTHFNANDYNNRRDNLFVIKERYDFFKKCPCSKGVKGCGYFILNLGFGCIYDCSYCFLQEYTNVPGIILHENLDDFLKEFSSFVKGHNTKNIRIGTGQFTDSLVLDYISEYSHKLVPFFSKLPCFFEFKTKSANIENLVKIKSSRNIVVSWSLNPQKIIDSEENYTASLTERIDAACECYDAGYSIGFHFDPIIVYDGWENHYKELVETLFCKIKDRDIAWISLGTLRFSKGLRDTAEIRFPSNTMLFGPFISGFDGKVRYPRNLRVEIYGKVVKWLRLYNKNTWVYLCMEDKPMWEKVFGF